MSLSLGLTTQLDPSSEGTPGRGGCSGGGRGAELISYISMLYIKSGVFHSGDFKNDVYFCVRVPPTLARAPLEGGAGGE